MRIVIANPQSLISQKFEACAGVHFEVSKTSTHLIGNTPEMLSDYDLAVIDEDTFDVQDCSRLVENIRRAGICTPLLVTGDCRDRSHIARIIDNGADNYQHSSIDADALRAFSQAIVRRHNTVSTEMDFIFGANGEYQYDAAKKKFFFNGEEKRQQIVLTGHEHEVLVAICAQNGNVTSRKMLQMVLYGTHRPDMANSIDVFMVRMRSKFKALGGSPTILTRRGEGYVLQMPQGPVVSKQNKKPGAGRAMSSIMAVPA